MPSKLNFCPNLTIMAKRQRNYKKLKTSPLKIALLLVQIILIKIGQLPLFIVYRLSAIVRKISSFRIPIYNIRYSINFPHLRRGKGRPRNNWFLPYYLNKYKLYFKKRVSGKTKFSLAALFILTL